MRRFSGFSLALAAVLAVSGRANAQILSPGDPVGFGRTGVSNYRGYGVSGPRGNGYFTGLYQPFDNQGPSFYYDPVWSSMNGYPQNSASRDWSFSPPWSASYRQGLPRRHLFARHKQD